MQDRHYLVRVTTITVTDKVVFSGFFIRLDDDGNLPDRPAPWAFHHAFYLGVWDIAPCSPELKRQLEGVSHAA